MDVNQMTPDEMRAHAYTFVEEGTDKTYHAFLDFCHEHFKGQMRLMMLAFVQAEGKESFQEYMAQDEEEA
jgi:hypothetical protein